MGATAQTLVEAVLDNLGALAISTHGARATRFVNDAYKDLCSSSTYRDFLELQSRATSSITTGTGTTAEGRQQVPFTTWASDVWIPISLRDATNDRIVPPLSITEMHESATTAASATTTGYAIYGTNIVLHPPLDATRSFELLYIKTVSPFTFDSDSNTVSGTSVLPDYYDEGIILGATWRLARTITPEEAAQWAQALSTWVRRRISQVNGAELEDSEHTIYPYTGLEPYRVN